MKVLTVEMPDGSRWCVPVDVISNSGPYDLLQINAEAIDLVRAIEAAHGITERKP